MSSTFNRMLITLCYFSLGGVWILFSNTLLTQYPSYQPAVPPIIEIGHWLFLLLSTGILYYLLHLWNSVQSKTTPIHQKLKQSLRFFREYSVAVAKAGDELALMHKACQICIDAGGHRMAWIASAEQDRNKTLKPITHYGTAGCFFDKFDATWDNTEKGKCPAGTSIRIGEPIIYQDLLANSRFKHRREAAKRCGFGSCISIPLRDECKIIAALIIFNANPNAFDREETKLLEELAEDVSTGITNIRKNREQLMVGDDRLMLAAITEQATDGVITFNPDGIIQYVNPSFIELCKIPLNKIIGFSIHEFECSERNPEFYQTILATMATSSPKAGQFVNKDSNGTEHNIDARISPVFDESNRIVRYIATIRDTTREIHLQRELQQAQKMETLATLSGTIIHAFKKQLLTISNYSKEGLNSEPDNTPRQEKFLSIFKATQNSHKLVDHFAAISHQNDWPKQSIKISMVINECVAELQIKLPTTIVINKKIGTDLEMVEANKKQIGQAIMSLCTNAIDAMQLSGGILEISLFNFECLADNGHSHDLPLGKYVKLTITDSGQGMNRNEMESIFEPFYTTKDQKNGHGLGLSIASKIIKNHDGTISVNSIVGVGTSFVILLPLKVQSGAGVAENVEVASNCLA